MIRFRLYCTSPSRERHDAYCSDDERRVRISILPGPRLMRSRWIARRARGAYEAKVGDDDG
jgi:hypothetical protein